MMERSTGKFEEIIRSALDGQKVYPSPGVLRTIRFRLWISDFFSVKPRKFNIAYASLLIAGLMAGFMLFPGKDETQESREKMSGSEFNNPQVQKDEIGETITAVPEQEEKSEMSKLKNAAPPVALFESNLIKGCAPLKVHFFNRSSGSEKFSWNFGTGEGSALTDPVYIFREPGNYEVSLQASNSQGTINKYTQTIQVFSAPAAEFSIDIDASDISGRKVVFDNLSSGGKKYIWDFGDSQQDTGFEQTHEYKNFGTYRVSLVAIAENGCSDTSVLENKFIEKNYELYFPVSFRPNPSTKDNHGFYETAGQESSVFYPNNFGADEYELRICAPNGMEVFKTDNIKQGWNGFIRGRLAPGGVYTYKAKGIYPNGKHFSIQGKVRVIVEDYYQN